MKHHMFLRARQLDQKTLSTSRNAAAVFLLCVAQHRFINTDRPKEDFFVLAFYKAGTQYVSAFGALFLEVCGHNQSLIASSDFDGSWILRLSLKASKSQDQDFGCLRKRNTFVSLGPR